LNQNAKYGGIQVDGTFWEVCQKSKEGDILINLDYPSQNIVNNGDFCFMWEEVWKPVKLTGEFLVSRWGIK
jgi:hypothetical protein